MGQLHSLSIMSAATYHKVFEYGFIKLITKGMDIDVSTKTP
jgi:hypothetical protein